MSKAAKVGAARRPIIRLPRPGQGIMIAMTDLFLSATATLLVVLAVSRTETPTPLPVQADFLLFCPSSSTQGAGSFLLVPAAQVRQSAAGDLVASASSGIAVQNQHMLGRAVARQQSPLGMVITIAAVAANDRPLTGTCYQQMRDALVAPHNLALEDKNRVPGDVSRAVLALQPVGLAVMIEISDDR